MNAHLSSPSIALKNAVSSLRTVGTVFILVGALSDFIAVAGPGIRSQGLQLVASASMFLLAPGIIYHMSATFIRRHDVKMAVLAQRTAILQCLAGVVGVTCLVIITPRKAPPFLFAAIPILFFIPALLAQAYEIGKALHALRMMPQTQRGFEVLAVLPIEEEAPAENAPADPPSSNHDKPE
jgi:hypothetical protein